MKSKTADTDGTIIEFMQGSHSYDGIWFGEPHPILKGQFWWRTILREYLSSGKFHHPVPDEAGEVYVWVKAMERLPDIDNKNPKHYLFLNEVNHHAIDIWTEFITNFPPLITSRLFDWKWLSPAPPSVEDAGKGWISVEDEMPIAYKTGVWDGQKSDLVLTYNAVDDTHCIATLYEGYLDGNHFKDWYHVDDFEIPTPTHWKPLTAPKP